jgi:hypothetical protein
MLPPRRRFAWISVVGCCCAVLSCTDQTMGAPVVTSPRPVAASPSPSTPAETLTIDPRIARLPGAAPFTFGGGGVWIAASSAGDGSKGFVGSLDTFGGSVTNTRRFGLLLEDIDFEHGALWVSATSGACVIYSCGMGGDDPPPRPRFPRENSVTKWDAAKLTLDAHVPITGPYQLEGGMGAVWVTAWGTDRSQLVALDPDSGRRMHVYEHPGDPGELVLAGGWVWDLTFIPRSSTRSGAWTLLQVDPSTGRPRGRMRLRGPRAGDPLSLDTGRGVLWIGSFETGAVYRVDLSSERLLSKISTGLRIVDVSAGPGGLWVVAGGSLARIDPRTGAVIDRFQLPGRARLWRVDQREERVWVSSNRGIFSIPVEV